MNFVVNASVLGHLDHQSTSPAKAGARGNRSFVPVTSYLMLEN